jgi:hypothetical protein
MGRKWLDNYGQEDNYNDSKISIPPGFVGQGYDVSGRNYSSAWGGQFQEGGNLEPKWEYSETNGTLLPQNNLKTSEINYLNEWLNSPMAKKIANKRQGVSGLENLNIRLERINDKNLEISTAEDLMKSNNSYTKKKGDRFNNKNLQGITFMNPSMKYGNIVTRKMAPENVILHEGAHQSTAGNSLLLKNDVEDILSRVKDDTGSYLSNPTEVHARLNVLRKELKDSGVVDPFKTPVSKEHLNKFLNRYKNPGEKSDKPLIEANSGELLNILNSQDDAVWLLNNIVSNQNNNLIPIAQNGRNLKRLLNDNIKSDSNINLNYTKRKNIDPGREIKKNNNIVEGIQNKYNVSRNKALEIKQKLETQKYINKKIDNPYEIKPGEDQSFLSKSWEVLTNPATAASYWLNDQRIPDRFSKGERNNLDIATDLFNPFGIVDSAKNAVKETISIPKNLYNSEYGEAGSNFLNAGLNTLSVVPALRELKGVKVPKINTSINSSSVNKAGLSNSLNLIDNNLFNNFNNKANEYISGVNEGIVESSLTGLKKLGLINKNINSRELSEIFPITKSQKEISNFLQDEEFKRATKFYKDYVYNNNGKMRPVIYNKMKKIFPEIDETENNLHIDHSRNPFNTTRDILINTSSSSINNSKLPKYIKNYLIENRGKINGVNFSDDVSLTIRNKGWFNVHPKNIGETAVHEGGHSIQNFGREIGDTDYITEPWSSVLTKYDPDFDYHTSNPNTGIGIQFKNSLVEPSKTDRYQTWKSSPNELHSELIAAKYNFYKKQLKEGLTSEEAMETVLNPTDKDFQWLIKNKNLNKHFKKNVSEEEKLKLLRIFPAMAVPITGSYILSQQKNGGIIKDNDGYWNPKNWGKVVEIDSNDITMKGVDQPLLGISDEGDVQYMEPNKDYKFKGKKVREFPIARNGINNLDENSLQQLDQLTNFTNYNKLSNGGWLDKV